MSLAISILHRADTVRSSVRSSIWSSGRLRARSVGGRGVAVLASFVVVTIAGGLLALSRSPLFAVRAIAVSGVEHLSADRIRALVDVDPGADLLWVDVAHIEARVEQEPWVADATLDRALPWTLSVSITERTPVAVASVSGRDMLVAGDGTLLGRARPEVHLPRLLLPAAQLDRGSTTSSGVPELARVASLLPAAVRPRVESLGLRDDGSLVLEVAGGPNVDFGAADDLRAKGRALRDVLSWIRRQRVSVGEISLVSPGAPAVSPSG